MLAGSGTVVPTSVKPLSTFVPDPRDPVICPLLFATPVNSSVVAGVKIPLGVNAVSVPPVTLNPASEPVLFEYTYRS
jgi:hypothetical protein